jgi:anti-sigma-K factor RskA
METGIHELTAAYALDALDSDERREYEAHLHDCESCQEELASFAVVTEALAVAASGPAPKPELRERVLAAAREEPQVVVPFAPPRTRRRALPAVAAVAALAAVVAVAVGVWAVQLSGDLDDTRTALERQREAAAIVADPDARTISLAAGQGRLVVGPDGRAVLVLAGLDPAPAGKTYEMWVVEGEVPAPAGLFSGEGHTELVDGTVEEGDVVAVTLEDAGGASTPSPPLLVASEPV